MITTKIECPVCRGVCGVEVAPGDWFDCDFCNATGEVAKGHVAYMQRSQLMKWDRRFIEMAEHIATWSKGPRKRIGAVIVRPDRSIASLGYNGPPRGYDDAAFLRMSRDEQHAVVIHAEINAIEQRHEAEDLAGYALFVSPLFPCHRCAARIIEAGITRVVAYCGHISPDWRASSAEAEKLFVEAGVSCVFLTD